MIRVRFWAPVLVLLLIGLLNVYSASIPIASVNHGDSLYFLKHQVAWAILATLLFFAVASIRLEFWRRIAPWAFGMMVALLFLMKVAGLGVVRNGAARWIALGPITVQPSEFAKPLLVVYLAKVLSSGVFNEKPKVAHYAALLAFSGLMMALVLVQPDFGGAVMLGVVMGAILFVAGAPIPLLGALAAGTALIGHEIIMSSPYKRGRLLAFMDPWADADAYGFQLIQSYLALGNGGWFGRGAGLGMQKLFFLPEAHTDFVFSVIGEEWGFAGALVVVLAIAWLLWQLFAVARAAQGNRFAHLVAVGVLVGIGAAYVFNLAVVTGLVPTKGLALPLVSYGGSALMATAFSLALVARVDTEMVVGE